MFVVVFTDFFVVLSAYFVNSGVCGEVKLIHMWWWKSG